MSTAVGAAGGAKTVDTSRQEARRRKARRMRGILRDMRKRECPS
jgi:hypothetical protein